MYPVLPDQGKACGKKKQLCSDKKIQNKTTAQKSSCSINFDYQDLLNNIYIILYSY